MIINDSVYHMSVRRHGRIDGIYINRLDRVSFMFTKIPIRMLFFDTFSFFYWTS